MSKLVPVKYYGDEYSTTLSSGVVQWDIGTKLLISGLKTSSVAVEVHFSLSEKDAESVRMVGEVIDGNIVVGIPKMITEAEGQRNSTYDGYAYVYYMDEESAWTERKINMVIKSKPKPTDYVSQSELSFLEQLEVIISKKMTTPAQGNVGQVIVVKSVDENGKPTEFEATDYTGGGGSGSDGVGIAKIEQTITSTEDSGINVMTITLTDEREFVFYFRNGSKGSKGDKGDKGNRGDRGDDGITPHIGGNGNWFIGTVDTGVRATGEDGTSVTVTNISESTESGGSNVVTFSDGNTVTIKNGKDGNTPVKGTDYYTEADKAEMVNLVLEALPAWEGGAY